MNDTDKNIEHGANINGVGYSVQFLRELFGTIRTDETTAAFDLLRLWESEQRKEQERLKAYGESLSAQHEQDLINKDD